MSSLSATTRNALRDITQGDCEEFQRNPDRNPLTGRAIQPDGPTAQQLRRRCEELYGAPNAAAARTRAAPQPEPIDLDLPVAETLRIVYEIGQARWENYQGRVPQRTVAIPTNNNRRGLPTDRHAMEFLARAMRQTSIERVLRFYVANKLGITYDAIMSGTAPPISVYHSDMANILNRPVSDRNFMMHLLWDSAAIRIPEPRQAEAEASQGIPFYPPNYTLQELEGLREHIPLTEYLNMRKAVEKWGQRSRSSPMERRAYSSASPREDAIRDQCKTLLAGVGSGGVVFRGLANRLKKVCNDVTKDCANVEAIRRPLWDAYRTSAIIKLNSMTPGQELRGIIKIMLSREKPFSDIHDDIFLGNIRSYNINYRDQTGVGEGVVRNAIQSMLDSVVAGGFFVPAEEGSLRHVINPDLTAEKLRQKGYIGIKDEEDILLAYRVIGRLFAFCLRNDIPIGIYLSRGMLARLVHRDSEIQPEEYVMYLLMDMPQTGTSLINLMRDPDSIEHIGLSMNDEFELVTGSRNADLTKDNFVEYLQRKAKHQLIKQIAEGKMDTSQRLKGMVDGFYVRNRLRRAGTTVAQLDKLLSGVGITQQSIRDWLARTPHPVEILDNGAEREVRIGVWLKEILSDFGWGFPVEELGREDRVPIAERRTMFLDFFGRLLYFWTGLRKMDLSRTYQVSFIDGPTPKASTCFYKLKLPNSIRSKQELYRKLVFAVYSVEAGVGLMGGQRRPLRQ